MEIDRELAHKLEEIFMPSLLAQRNLFFDADPQKRVMLAHYTSAETAVNIIQSQSLWLRNARGMEDFSEVRYGHKLGHEYFADQTRANRFVSKFQREEGNPASAGIDLFNKWIADMDWRTFLTCFSAHGPESEPHGRLSMWRTFSASASSVALIFNAPEPYSALPMRSFLAPVSYPIKKEDHWADYERILQNVDANKAFVEGLPANILAAMIATVLLMHAVSLKHPAFAEEREWRLCHFPELFPSDHVTKQVQSVRGIPQIIYEVPLRNNIEQGITGVSLPQLLHSVKIGPTRHADVIWQALVTALEKAGVPDAAKKVVYTNIPLRV